MNPWSSTSTVLKKLNKSNIIFNIFKVWRLGHYTNIWTCSSHASDLVECIDACVVSSKSWSLISTILIKLSRNSIIFNIFKFNTSAWAPYQMTGYTATQARSRHASDSVECIDACVVIFKSWSLVSTILKKLSKSSIIFNISKFNTSAWAPYLMTGHTAIHAYSRHVSDSVECVDACAVIFKSFSLVSTILKKLGRNSIIFNIFKV